jgi:hypothetical protein
VNTYEYDLTFEEDLAMAVEDASYGESWGEQWERSQKLPSLRADDIDNRSFTDENGLPLPTANAILKEAGHEGIHIRTEWQEELYQADHRFLETHGESRRSYIPALPALYRDASGKLVTKAPRILRYIKHDPELTAIMERSGFEAASHEWQRQVARKQWKALWMKPKPTLTQADPVDVLPEIRPEDLTEEEQEQFGFFVKDPTKGWLRPAIETLPPVQQRLVDTMVGHLPDPPKPTDKAYPRYDARRLKDPNKLRRSSGMPRNKMYGTIRQAYEGLLELARCKRYAVDQGLDYFDGKPHTTPKPFNKLVYLLERQRFGGRPTMPPLGTNQTVKTLAIGDDTIPVKWKTVKREPTTPDDVVIAGLTNTMAKYAWSAYHIDPLGVIEACGEYAKVALLAIYGWMDRRCSAANNPYQKYFNRVKPKPEPSPWPKAIIV